MSSLRAVMVAALLSLAVAPSSSVVGQDSAAAPTATRSGVYLSADAFRRGDLTLAIDCAMERHRIDLHAFWERPYIDVEHRGQRHRYQKRDIFGYRGCDGRDVRFFAGTDYQVAEAGPITVYTRHTSVMDGKVTKQVVVSYFSTAPEAPIRPLTVAALKAAYPDDHRFHDLLDLAFRPEDDVGAYDALHRTYRVNRLFMQSRQ